MTTLLLMLPNRQVPSPQWERGKNVFSKSDRKELELGSSIRFFLQSEKDGFVQFDQKFATLNFDHVRLDP
jgi:hypothetical protein